MATKNSCLSHAGIKSTSNSDSSQFFNLNLNQNHKCSKINSFQSKTISNKNKDERTFNAFPQHFFELFSKHARACLEEKYSLINSAKTAALNISSDYYNPRENVNDFDWNKSEKEQQLCSKFAERLNLYDSHIKEKNLKQFNLVKSSLSRSSTLSLHIAAYENAIIEAGGNKSNTNLSTVEKTDTKKFSKTWKNVKQHFVQSSRAAAIASPFEIPRQQDDTPKTPEVMQFKSSQKIFNFNDGGSPKAKTSDKDGGGLSMALLSPRRFFESKNATNPNQSIHLRPRDTSNKIRKGLVIEVNEQYGRILCSRSFGDLGVFVFFDRNTTVNGTPFCLSDVDLMSAVPLGVEVDFKVTFGFPSKWRSFGTYMGYYCDSLKYDCTQHVTMFHTELLAKETRHDGLVIGFDGVDGKAVIHPHIWPSPNTIRKLYTGAELEPKKNHRFQVLTQQSRTLLALVRPVPTFLKTKLRRMKYIAISAQPLSTTVVCYAYLVGIGPAELLFDSLGIRDDTGDNVPVEIVMDRNLFLSSIGFDKGQSGKVNLIKLIGEAFQLGCVRNLSTQRHPLRAFCAYLCNKGMLPRNPKVHMPREYSKNVRKASTNLKALPTPFLEKKASKLDTSFTQRSFYRKFYVRRSYRANPRKRAFTPCSPYTDLTAKRKNLNESMHDVSLSDF